MRRGDGAGEHRCESSASPEPVADPDTWEAVVALSVRQRAVVFLTYWEDLDGPAVAEALGISLGSVHRHLHRARETLRRKIDV